MQNGAQPLWGQQQNQPRPVTYATNSKVCCMYSPCCPALLSYIIIVPKYDTDKIWLNTVRVCPSNVVSLRAQNSCLTEALPGSSNRREVVGTANVIQHGLFQVAHFEKKKRRTVEAVERQRTDITVTYLTWLVTACVYQHLFQMIC